MANARFVIGIGLLAAVMSGCAGPYRRDSPERMNHGLTIVLPGIEGTSPLNANVAKGIASAYPERAVEVHDWTTGNIANFLYHLRGDQRNEREAERLAAKIVDYRQRYPGRPVFLIGHSGGGAMALRTVEALPEGHTVDGVILLAAAVSRDYDLRPALSKVQRGIWNYHSSGDVVLLVAGTSIAGTADGVHAPSAGAYGFRPPPGSWRFEYSKLRQIPFRTEMMTSGNFAGHFGATTVNFAERYLARHLRGRD